MTNVLAIGAHPDDVDLGCGGTLAKHVAHGDTVTVLIVTKGEAGPGAVADRMHEAGRAASVLGANTVVWGSHPDGLVSTDELGLVHLIEDTIERHGIECVYTHNHADSHQDHRAVALASLGAARHAKSILAYDSPSSLGFAPSVFVDITAYLEKKLQALRAHASQVNHSAMASTDLVRTNAGYRGFQARVESAEGFVPIRLMLEL
jgi:LmbE family N-acetylglucosaminyl deacetylase